MDGEHQGKLVLFEKDWIDVYALNRPDSRSAFFILGPWNFCLLQKKLYNPLDRQSN